MPRGPRPTVKVPRTVPSLARSFVTVPPLLPPPFVIQTFAPSKATALGELPTTKLPRFLPSLARSFVTQPLPLALELGTQIFAPSNAIHHGNTPGTGNDPKFLPSLARSFVTELSGELTQTLAPSKVTPAPPLPAANIPRTAPSLARNLVAPMPAATQMFAPSKATPSGPAPTANSLGAVFALYHFSSATFSGFDNGGAPFPASCCADAGMACCALLTNKFAIARTTTIRDTPITIRVFMTFYSCGRSRNIRLGKNVVYQWRELEDRLVER